MQRIFSPKNLSYARALTKAAPLLLVSPSAIRPRLRNHRDINMSASTEAQAAATAAAHASNHISSDVASSGAKQSFWDGPGSAAFDLRSDVVTTPTREMLSAIASSTLQDDVWAEDPTTLSLEARVAQLAGHEAAVLVLSGTMGNQLAVRTHLSAPPHGVLADSRSHLMGWEAGGMASLSGAFAQPAEPKTNGHHLTLEDVQRVAVVSDDVHACPTRIVSLENTLNGTIMPLEECRRISEWARARGIIVHLDGARLWEGVAAGAGSLEEFCACFDSVSLCFSKGLGAPIGSILVGSQAFVKRARWVRKSIGGGLRQSGVVAAPARVAVESTFLGGKLRASHENAKRVAAMWTGLGGKLAYPVETNMAWLDIAHIREEDWAALAAKHRLRLGEGRLVVHYQIGEEAIARLKALFEDAMALYPIKGVNGHA